MEELELYLKAATSQIPWKKSKELWAELEDHIMTKAELLCLTGITMEQSIRQVLNEMGNANELSNDFQKIYKYSQPTALMRSLGLMLTAFALFSLQFKSLLEIIQYEPVEISESFRIGGAFTLSIQKGQIEPLYSVIRLAFIKGLFDWKIILLQFVYLGGNILLICSLWELRTCSRSLRQAWMISIAHIVVLCFSYPCLLLTDFPDAWHMGFAALLLCSKIVLFTLIILGLYQVGRHYYIHASPILFLVGLLLLYILPIRLTRPVDHISISVVFFLFLLTPFISFMRQLWKADADVPVYPERIRFYVCQAVIYITMVVGILAIIWLLPKVYPERLHEHIIYKDVMLWM